MYVIYAIDLFIAFQAFASLASMSSSRMSTLELLARRIHFYIERPSTWQPLHLPNSLLTLLFPLWSQLK